MYDEIFVLSLGVAFILLFAWAFKTLPQEDWQILATVPLAKDSAQNWKGLNLTYYGIFIALATMIGVFILLVLTSAIYVPIMLTFLVVGFILVIGLAASKAVALLVENKPYTFTIAGACFAGVFAVPPIILILDRFIIAEPNHLPVIPILASFSIAYAIGEGLGRLACISFGCCYGKPLSECHPIVRGFFGKCGFVFTGKLKKIAYERGLDGENVVPVQAVTAILYVTIGLIATLFFLKGHSSLALLLTIIVTQSWRVFSETLRADYRGPGNFTAYQVMSLASIAYVFLVVYLMGTVAVPAANVATGLASLWDPTVILFLQCVGLVTFVYTGRSMVTAATISFHIVRDRI